MPGGRLDEALALLGRLLGVWGCTHASLGEGGSDGSGFSSLRSFRGDRRNEDMRPLRVGTWRRLSMT